MKAPISQLQLRRVVVTGVGIASPLGIGREVTWRGLLDGKSGLRTSSLPIGVPNIVGEIPKEDECMVEKMCNAGKGNSRFVSLGLLAAEEARKDAGDVPLGERAGSSIGSGIGALEEATRAYEALKNGGHRKVSPFFVPRLLANMAAGNVAIAHDLRGPLFAPATACAAGAQAVGDAFRAVQRGDADVMFAGGTESSVLHLSMAGFHRVRALAADGVSCPFDEKRSGFVLSEGAAVLVLEDYESARRRGAPRIYAEVRGYGSSADAHGLVAPLPSGHSAAGAMRRALRDSGVDRVHYVNAHAASTPQGDAAEAKAIASAAGENVAVSSTKGATGHLLGAAGALEAAVVALTIRDRTAPATLNLVSPLKESNLDFIVGTPRHFDEAIGPLAALTNSFGFGGVNASLLLTTPPSDDT